MTKKKILLVTWYKSTNCGTCLQAYALYSILSEKYDVSFLGKRTYYRLFNSILWKKIWGALKRNIRNTLFKNAQRSPFLFLESIKKQQIKFQRFIAENYSIQSLKSRKDYNMLMKHYDCFIIGSDQLWNPVLFSTTFMLDFVPISKRKASYAASFGIDNIPNKIRGTYKKLLLRLDEISVREPRAKELVKDICGKDSKLVLDPTFLKTPQEWRVFANIYSNVQCEYNIPENYIISYFIGSTDFNHINTVKLIAKKMGCKVVVIPNKITDYIEDKELTIIYDVCCYDFIQLIDQARLICTDSFHAVVFSFLMDKDFFIFSRFKKDYKYSQNNRLDNILNTFHLENRKWEDCWLDSLDQHIGHDYSSSYIILEKLRDKCKNYLLNLPLTEKEKCHN